MNVTLEAACITAALSVCALFLIPTHLVRLSSPKYPLDLVTCASSGTKNAPVGQLPCFQHLVNALPLFAAPTLCFQYCLLGKTPTVGGMFVNSTPSSTRFTSVRVRRSFLPLPRGNRKYVVLGRRHRNVAFAVAPEDGIQDLVVGLVRVPPVHRRRCFCSRGGGGIAFEN